MPTFVIHGDADPLVPLEEGKNTAEAFLGVKLMIIEDMGHPILTLSSLLLSESPSQILIQIL